MDLCMATARAKRSCAEKGYVDDKYVKYFVGPLDFHMDPTMHRGYHARMGVVDVIVNEFVAENPSGQVIVLGAGMDTGYWRRGQRHGLYIECDRTSVITKKRSIIQRNSELSKTANAEHGFHLIGCDLADAAQVAAKVQAAGASLDLPTLFVAEAALAYLTEAQISELLEWAASFKSSALAHYDVIAADDRFGKQMVDSFARRGWPLYGAAQSIATYKERISPPFSQVEAADMFEVYQACVLNTPEERKRVARLEIFDDPDEFKLLMQHSVFLVAVNGDHFMNTLLASFRRKLTDGPLPDPLPVLPDAPSLPSPTRA